MTDPYSKGGEPRPWDHAYEADAGEPCVTCGWIGSYAHTEEFYRKWVWPAGRLPWDPDPRYVEPEPPTLAEHKAAAAYVKAHTYSEPRRSVVIPLVLASVVGVGLLALWVAVKW